jgi:hypothetical protein
MELTKCDIYYSGNTCISLLPHDKFKIKINFSTDGEEIVLNETVPTGKKWIIDLKINIHEIDT